MSDTSSAEGEAFAARAHAEAAKFLAEAAKLEAEARQHDAEAAKAEAEAREADAKARTAELDTSRKERERREADAADAHHYVLRFVGGVDPASAEKAIGTLAAWHRLAPIEQPFEIVFFSLGGGVLPGFALFDQLRSLSAQGRHIITGCTGVAASMGGILVQAGDHRWMSSESWLMIHRAAFASVGKTFEIEDEVKWVQRIEKRILDIFARRSEGRLTAAKIRRNWDRKDWWIESNEALAFGLVDEVR